jgi:DnaK suppressor protein
MMNEKQLDTFRQALISLREELEQLENACGEATGTVELDQSKVGRLSRMDALQAQQMAQETSRRRQLQLRKIDGALHRMDAGDYGHCVICGDEIVAARLNFDPTSTRCMECMDN